MASTEKHRNNLTKWKKFQKYRYCFRCKGYSDNNNGRLKECICKNEDGTKMVNIFYPPKMHY